MPFQIVTATKKIANLKKRIRAVCGGTAASKTVSIIAYLIDKAQRDKKATKTSIVSESFPHLSRGAEEDFKNILKEQGYWKDSNWNGTNHVYTFETGSRIEFFSADQPDKVRGPRRDRLFINEANNIPFETYEQLEIRTREYIFLDWNPTNEFWFYEYVKGNDDCDFLTLTYKDNESLDNAIVKSIESRRGRKNWWRVYGLGLLGELEGKIYSGWKQIDDIPHEARLIRRGIDFGYTNDETAIVDIYKYNDGYILDEITYLKGLSNKKIADIILNQEDEVLNVADSAEPKSIDEIKSYGVNIIGAKKKGETGKSYNKWAIEKVQDQRISVTKRSLNIWKEYRNYMWMTDKEGRIINEPEDLFNHTMDAIKYGICSIVSPVTKSINVYRPQTYSKPLFEKSRTNVYKPI